MPPLSERKRLPLQLEESPDSLQIDETVLTGKTLTDGSSL